jgi:hypothetical protein
MFRNLLTWHGFSSANQSGHLDPILNRLDVVGDVHLRCLEGLGEMVLAVAVVCVLVLAWSSHISLLRVVLSSVRVLLICYSLEVLLWDKYKGTILYEVESISFAKVLLCHFPFSAILLVILFHTSS